MPDPATIGAFSAYAARLSLHGDFSPDGCTDEYTVYVADPDERLDLSDVSGLPDLGAEHPLDEDLTVAEFRIREHRPGELLRVVEVVYTRGEEETEGGSGSQTSVGKLTALDYPIYTQSGDLVTDQVNGGKVLNSAGDVYDSVPQFETLFTGVHFTRRVSSFPSAAIMLSGTVNSADISIYGVSFAKRTARCRVTARYTFDGSTRPWEMDVTVEPRHNFADSGAQYRYTNGTAAMNTDYSSVAGRGYDLGWDIAILDCGFEYLDSSSGSMVPFTVMVGGQTTTPQLPQKLTAQGGDGRSYGNESYLVVRTALGASWDALKAKSSAPS